MFDNVTFHWIHGLNFGIEHVAKDEEMDIEETVIIVDLGIFRWIIGMGDYEPEE